MEPWSTANRQRRIVGAPQVGKGVYTLRPTELMWAGLRAVPQPSVLGLGCFRLFFGCLDIVIGC